MSGPRIGELFGGYGGLGQGVQAVLGGDIAWFSEFDKAPSKILAHHWPDVPNLGDVTKIKWTPDCPHCDRGTAVYGPVDETQYYCTEHGYLPDSIRELDPEAYRIPMRVHVMSGGFPCQDVSLAGARRGLKDGTRSGLWSYFAAAINALKPELVVIENVRGLLSADASSGVESCPECVGDGPDAVSLRALGAVLGDLADIGYDAEWAGVRAADAGAPHGRFRVFVLAYPQGEGLPSGGTRSGEATHENVLHEQPQYASDDIAHASGGGRDGRAREQIRRPIERVTTAGNSEDATQNANLAVGDQRRQSTPRQEESGRTRTNAGRRSRTPATDSNSTGLAIGGTPGVAPGAGGKARTAALGNSAPTDWGDYEPAIRRWEAVTGRSAPAPTNGDGKNGSHRLSARFVEWMMGLDDGHVTDVGLTRNEQLKALGNGVVPQQAEMALRVLLSRQRVAA